MPRHWGFPPPPPLQAGPSSAPADFQFPGDPGSTSLEEGHDLTLVVDASARVEAIRAAAVAKLGLERRRYPQIQRIHRLHIVVAVEQDMRNLLTRRPIIPMRDHHGMQRRLAERDLELHGIEFACQPLRGSTAITLVCGIGRDRRDSATAPSAEQRLRRVDHQCRRVRSLARPCWFSHYLPSDGRFVDHGLIVSMALPTLAHTVMSS